MTFRQLFLDARAGATAFTAMGVTLMTLGGAALIGDHVWLVDQRDFLKAAAESAGIAATKELNRLESERPDLSDADLHAELQRVAERYVELNLKFLPPDRLALALATMDVDVDVDRTLRTVAVSLQADVGGTLLARHIPMLGDSVDPGSIRSGSVVASTINPVEVVLAIDVSESMDYTLEGIPCQYDRRCYSEGNTRLVVVKRAATSLVDILQPDAEARVAIGLVPWHRAVRLDDDTAADWERNNWVRYPTRRVYGQPYKCRGGACNPPAPIVEALPDTAPVAWNGCLDSHRTGASHPRAALPPTADFFVPPSDIPFAQRIFPAIEGSSYQCLSPPLPADFDWQICYHGKKYGFRGNQAPVVDPQNRLGRRDVQPFVAAPPNEPLFGCASNNPPIIPLSTDADAVRRAIGSLSAVGGRTYSALGVLWGQRLLDHAWNRIWGGGLHPADPDDRDNAKLRKAIVLLTDGDDTQCGTGNPTCKDSEFGFNRADACEAAKAEGTEIFVITAMPAAQVSGALGSSLRACSSQSDNPDGSYVFLNNSTPESLRSAFTEIALQLRGTRRLL